MVVVDQSPNVQVTADSINDAGGRAIALVKDASSEADVEGVVKTAVNEFGQLDVVYANAGISGGLRPYDDLTAQDWLQILQVNLIGPFLAIKYAARVMVPQGHGSIICTASVAGLRSGAGR